MTPDFPTTEFLDLRFDLPVLADALSWVANSARGDEFFYVVTPNVDHVIRLHDPDLPDVVRSAYRGASLTVCDSRIVGLMARLSGRALTIVPGSDLTAAILASARFDGLHALVVGGSPATLALLGARFGHLRWSQFVPPPNVMGDPLAQQAIVDAVISTRADIVFMAFGSLQSELVCGRIAKKGGARGVALCVGASVEFVTGEKLRAPRMVQLLHAEWLFRLLSEPRRLWRRYLVVGPQVFLIWARWRRRDPRTSHHPEG